MNFEPIHFMLAFGGIAIAFLAMALDYFFFARSVMRRLRALEGCYLDLLTKPKDAPDA